MSVPSLAQADPLLREIDGDVRDAAKWRRLLDALGLRPETTVAELVSQYRDMQATMSTLYACGHWSVTP